MLILSQGINWEKILGICEEKIRSNISPHLASSFEAQPDLGKGAGGDPIKLVDLAAERAIIKTLLDHKIAFTLISEESGVKKFEGSSQHFYVTVDPIDGTTNLVHKIPFYCSSIAISKKLTLSSVNIGMVVDFVHDINYFAEKGQGAYCNGKKIMSSQCNFLKDAIIGLDLNDAKTKHFIPRIKNLLKEIKHIRHLGANALELCYVADGKIEAFVDIRGKLRATDLAASYLILNESGGLFTTIDNTPLEAKLDPQTRINFIASGNSRINEKILNLLKNNCFS